MLPRYMRTPGVIVHTLLGRLTFISSFYKPAIRCTPLILNGGWRTTSVKSLCQVIYIDTERGGTCTARTALNAGTEVDRKIDDRSIQNIFLSSIFLSKPPRHEESGTFTVPTQPEA